MDKAGWSMLDKASSHEEFFEADITHFSGKYRTGRSVFYHYASSKIIEEPAETGSSKNTPLSHVGYQGTFNYIIC